MTKWQRGTAQFVGRGVKHEAKNTEHQADRVRDRRDQIGGRNRRPQTDLRASRRGAVPPPHPRSVLASVNGAFVAKSVTPARFALFVAVYRWNRYPLRDYPRLDRYVAEGYDPHRRGLRACASTGGAAVPRAEMGRAAAGRSCVAGGSPSCAQAAPRACARRPVTVGVDLDGDARSDHIRDHRAGPGRDGWPGRPPPARGRPGRW